LQKDPTKRFQTAAEVKKALEPLAGRSRDGERPIAVLPFENMSGDKENEYFSDGLAEEIINALTRIPGLKVIARTSAFAFKGKHDDIRRIAEALGVTTVLEGSRSVRPISPSNAGRKRSTRSRVPTASLRNLH
jgi:TolB-like protein